MILKKINPSPLKKITCPPFTRTEHHHALFYFSVSELQNRVITLDREERKTIH